MEKKILLQQPVAGLNVTLFNDGRITLHRDTSLVGEGSLDSVVLTQWGEAHLDGCNARLAKDPDESEALYEQIDDALSIALSEDKALAAQLALPRSKHQLTLLAEHWVEQLTPAEKAEVLQRQAEPLKQRLQAREFLSPEQLQGLMDKIELLLREA